MLRFVRYFLFIALFGTAFSLKATHNRAGEITYKWISGFTYSITLTTYTDDGPSIADRCQMTIYFGDGNTCVANRENGTASSGCPGAYNGVILFPGFKKNVYSCIHTYSIPGAYKIYIFDRNRNAGVINVPNSVNQPFYIESLLLIQLTHPRANNSNQLTVLPLYEAVINGCFYHNPGAFDIDGDSLSYEIIACKGEDAVGTIGATVPGYTYPDPGSTGSFSIDPATGTLSWYKPQQAGEFNIAFLIKEWRKTSCNGIYYLVGYVMRDMQVIVQASGNLGAPVFSLMKDTCVLAGTNLSINMGATDQSGIQFTGLGTPFMAAISPAYLSVSTSTSGTFNWTPDCESIKALPHVCLLKATDYGLPSLSAFITQNITVVAPEPKNLSVNPGLNTMQLSWNKSACHLTTGNNVVGYNVYRKTSATGWVHSPCERGVPASTGFVYIGGTPSVNDTVLVDFSIISLPNNTTCSYAVCALYSDCAESYASTPVSNQIVIGIDEKTKSNYSVNVFPNPSQGIFNLKLTAQKQGFFTIELLDVNGRKVKQLNTTFVNGSSDLELNLKELENGYYILKIESEEKNSSYKPIVKLD
jgi:hypothetical protein